MALNTADWQRQKPAQFIAAWKQYTSGRPSPEEAAVRYNLKADI
jgi:hypothetical protein